MPKQDTDYSASSAVQRDRSWYDKRVSRVREIGTFDSESWWSVVLSKADRNVRYHWTVAFPTSQGKMKNIKLCQEEGATLWQVHVFDCTLLREAFTVIEWRQWEGVVSFCVSCIARQRWFKRSLPIKSKANQLLPVGPRQSPQAAKPCVHWRKQVPTWPWQLVAEFGKWCYRVLSFSLGSKSGLWNMLNSVLATFSTTTTGRPLQRMWSKALIEIIVIISLLIRSVVPESRFRHEGHSRPHTLNTRRSSTRMFLDNTIRNFLLAG